MKIESNVQKEWEFVKDALGQYIKDTYIDDINIDNLDIKARLLDIRSKLDKMEQSSLEEFGAFMLDLGVSYVLLSMAYRSKKLEIGYSDAERIKQILRELHNSLENYTSALMEGGIKEFTLDDELRLIEEVREILNKIVR